MVKRRAKHPLEDNPFIEGFLEWMDAPEGQQSIQALDQVFDALEHAGVDARHRKIVWVDGKRLSIEQSVERIHAKGLSLDNRIGRKESRLRQRRNERIGKCE
jgi:hypothetical protein